MSPDLLPLYNVHLYCPRCGHTGCLRGANLAEKGMSLSDVQQRALCTRCRAREGFQLAIVRADTGDPFSR